MQHVARPNIRVLVVDDSAVIRGFICDRINAEPGMEIAGTAADGQHALEVLDALCPDVITLDVHMPRMDGLSTLDAILRRRPTPVIMVSSLTRMGADTTLDALERGAIDYVVKPSEGGEAEALLGEELPRKIRMAAGTDVRKILEIRRQRKQRHGTRALHLAANKPCALRSQPPAEACIVLGISTGGPPALTQLFESLSPPLPPIVVVQHMPPRFTKPLAWRLNSVSALAIKEAENGDVLRPNHVLVAEAGRHLQLRRDGRVVKAVVFDGAPVSGHRPSIDVLMRSAAQLFGPRCLGVIMTGMGRDGAGGCRAIRCNGGYVLGQDEATSDVYGMNKVAFVEGNVDRQFALDKAAAVISLRARRLAAAVMDRASC